MKRVIFVFLLLVNSVLFAQLQFEARVSKTELGIDERLKIDFIMNFDGDNFVAPEFENSGFAVMSGPSQMVSQVKVNNRYAFNKQYTYFLMPLKKGTLTIKPAYIEFGNKIYKSNPIKITVTDAVNDNPYNNQNAIVKNPIKLANEGVELVAEISNTNPYLNEPITILYKIYVNNRKAAVVGWKELSKPKYENFWTQSESIDGDNIKIENVKYKGEIYLSAVLRKTILYPQKSGNLEIEPLNLNVEIEVPTGRVDFMGNLEYVIQNKRVVAGSKVINVKALPTPPKGTVFTGAVGTFDYQVTPSTTTLQGDQSLELTVSVSGKGNLKLFDLPKPTVSSELEQFEPQHSENVNTGMNGMTGSILDKYTIVPQKKGIYKINPLPFVYFDLNSKSYKIINSNPIEINVLDNPKDTSSGKNSVSNAKEYEESTNKIDAVVNNIATFKFLSSKWFYISLLTPLVAFLLLMVYKRNKKEKVVDLAAEVQKTRYTLAKKYLSEAQSNINQKESFYTSLEKAFHNFLKSKLNIETSEMSKEKIKEILLIKKAQPETISQFIKVLESCEMARYAPSNNDVMQNDYEKSVEVIAELDKQIQS